MKRRALLTSVGALTVGIAGCYTRANSSSLSTPEADGNENPETTIANGDQDTTDSSSENSESVFTDTDCPSFANAVDRTVCWPIADTAGENIYLDDSAAIYRPDPRDAQIETIEFVLHNEHSAHPFRCNPGKWTIKRQSSDGWTTAAAGTSGDTAKTLNSGQQFSWRLSSRMHPSPNDEQSMDIYPDLDNGTYAFQLTGTEITGSATSQQVECIALFKRQQPQKTVRS